MCSSRTENKLLSLKVALLRSFCLCSRTKHVPPQQKVVWGRPGGKIRRCVLSPCDGRRSHAEDRTERTSCDGCRVKLLTQAACLENQALEIFLESDPSPGSSGKPAASEGVRGSQRAAPGGRPRLCSPNPASGTKKQQSAIHGNVDQQSMNWHTVIHLGDVL